MDDLELRPLDVGDDAELRAWYDVYRAAEAHGREFHGAFSFEEVRGRFRSPGEDGLRPVAVTARRGDQVVGVGSLALPLLDNLDTGHVDVGVAPEHRGRGVGAALLEHLAGLARHERRTRLLAEVWAPYDGRAGDGAARFAERNGFTLGLGDVQRVLDLPVDEALLDRLERLAAGKHAGYTFRDVTGPLPDELVLPVGRIRAAVETEAPMGEIAKEPEYVDADRVRAEERVVEAMGRRRFATLAFAPDGELAGYTEVAVPEFDPPWIFQWGTLVRREHRGRSLGLAMKVRNTRWVQALFPDRAAIRTWNAEVNTPMVAVNELLGYRPVARLGEWQRRI